MSLILDHGQQPNERQVGGKFAKQAEMISAGFAVPEFVCLTQEFYLQVSHELQDQIKDLLKATDFSDFKQIEAGSLQIRTWITSLSLSQQHESDIFAAFDQHFRQDSLVSVRASTVGIKSDESEDSLQNPFAGMSESFLYVPRNELIDKVKLAWASGYSPESLIYRHTQSMDVMGFSVAVGIQKMVFGQRSFVMFTADPKTAARDTVIIAGFGIGEGVVQERVAVDHYFVNGKSGDITHKLQLKDTQLVFDEQAGSGLISTDVPQQKQKPACLTDSEITDIAAQGKKIESLFGLPQDIEGTITEDGTVYFLQSRPIALDFGRQLVWTNTNVTESYPGVSSALTYSHAKYFYRVIFRDLYRRLGVDSETIWGNFQPLDNMIGYLKGHVYYCLSHFYLLHKQNPLYPLFGSHWENMIGLSSSYQTQEQNAFSAAFNKLRAGFNIAKALVNVLVDFFNHDKAMYRYHRWWEKLLAPMRGKSFNGEDPLVLVNRFYDLWTQVGREWGVTLTTDAYLIPMYGWAEALFEKWDLEAQSQGLLSDLLCGDEQLLSVEIILSAVKLAEYVGSQPQLKHYIVETDEKMVWYALQAGDIDTSFSDGVNRHLQMYGDRGLQELKLEQPSLRDTPWILIRMIRQYVIQGVTVQSFRDHEKKVRQEADRTLEQILKQQPLRLYLLQKIMLPRLRRLIRHRENSRYCRSELFGFSKQIFKALAHYLVERGVLRSEDDIFHLTQDEVFGYINGMGVTENLQAIADIRRCEYERNLAIETAEQITTLGAIHENNLLVAQDLNAGSGALQGLGSSAGKVQGTAKIISDPNQVDVIAEDMILVARETDPGWLFLMLAAKGMVVERGSMLSHTAITGRKFGIPTIVALSNATKIIPDGAKIEIDGATGVVTLLDSKLESNNSKSSGEVV
jgi:phosphoenolpyruvate synthase/pyruvate phosphate dikinase